MRPEGSKTKGMSTLITILSVLSSLFDVQAFVFYLLLTSPVMLFGDVGGCPQFGKVVEDPYFGGKNGFDINFNQLVFLSESFISQVL